MTSDTGEQPGDEPARGAFDALFESPGFQAMMRQQSDLAAEAVDSIGRAFTRSMRESGAMAAVEGLVAQQSAELVRTFDEALRSSGVLTEVQRIARDITSAGVENVRTALEQTIVAPTFTAEVKSHLPAFIQGAEATFEPPAHTFVDDPTFLALAAVALVLVTIWFGCAMAGDPPPPTLAPAFEFTLLCLGVRGQQLR